MVAENSDKMSDRVGFLEQKVAEHEVRLETACASLEKVADRLDLLCQNLAKLVGEEAGRNRFVNLWVGASVTTLLSLVIYVVTIG